MGIRDKLLDFKRRLSDRKMYSIVILTLAVISSVAIYQYKAKLNYKNYVENGFNRAFFDLTGYVQNVEVGLAKAMVSSTPNQTAIQLNSVWREANSAQANLGQLPLTNIQLQKTAKFLSQVGDYSYTLSNQLMSGKKISDSQLKSLESLHNYSMNLEKSLVSLEGYIQSGRSMWGQLQSQGPSTFQKASGTLMVEKVSQLESQFTNYPSLIYDGPFSEHLQKPTIEMLKGKSDITAAKAMNVARDFVGKDKVSKISNTSSGNGNISTYGITINGSTTPGNTAITVDVTKKGGFVLFMLNSRPIGTNKINVDKAKALAKNFLDSKGFTGMKDTYYMSEYNTATINFAYVQNGIIMYPDLIKVKVALDNGEIVGFESRGYLTSHRVRTLPTPKISAQDVMSRFNSRLQATTIGLAVIPLDNGQEVFTYEVKGTVGDKNFLSYINVENGNEEKILMIIQAPNGILTM